MKKNIVSFLVIMLFLTTVFSVTTYSEKNLQDNQLYRENLLIQPTIEWSKCFGEVFAEDFGQCVRQTTDGGYIITGLSYSYDTDKEDVYLIKTYSNGDLEWSKHFVSTENESSSCIQQTTDGGYIIVGTTGIFGSVDSDILLIKTDSDGNMNWMKTLGGINDEWGSYVQQTLDGGYIIVGTTNSFGSGNDDVYLVKIERNGNFEWSNYFGGTENERGYCVQQTTDGGYIIVGSTSSFGSRKYDVYLIKTDSNGNMEWPAKIYGGSDTEEGRCVQQTTDVGGYIIVGTTYSFGSGNGDILLIKTDINGNFQWTPKYFGGTGYEIGSYVQQTSDGGYIITGSTSPPGFLEDVYLIKTDFNGNPEWEEQFYQGGIDWGNCVQETADHGYIISGYTTSCTGADGEVYLIKIKSENHPPSNPECSYDSSNDEIEVYSTDIEGDKIRYGVSWDDNRIVDHWTTYYKSGYTVSINCGGRRNKVGVIAEDELGAQSGWVSTNVKNKSLKIFNSEILRLIERFPILEYLL